jgi:hypothetical protein
MYRVHVVFMCSTVQRSDRITKPLSVACIADVPKFKQQSVGLQNQIGEAISVMTDSPYQKKSQIRLGIPSKQKSISKSNR